MKLNKKERLDSLLNRPSNTFEKFFEQTKIKKLSKDLLDPQKWPREWKEVQFKAYPRMKEIILPSPKFFPGTTFQKILFQRKSGRSFTDKPITSDKLSNLLYFSAGLKSPKAPWLANRFYPSAGSRYPLEVYLLCLNCEIPKGLYHYYLKNHSLELLLKFDKFSLTKYVNQAWAKRAACFIIITGVAKRTTVKYGERGYRHMLTEAGHLGQNFYLVGSTLGISCCSLGGYNDMQMEKLLDIDGQRESIVSVLVFGNPLTTF